MNSPAENRRRVEEGQQETVRKNEQSEAWAKMLRNSHDQKFAEAQGRLIPGSKKDSTYMANQKEL